ncbi:uncharacterized protein LOC127716189 [Mytilus californianus]|uniref:uncharacterized protein LOC127716189 n=1 Tax=Mytilus californianus TaxID=6549 RepID=UPI002245C79D|nr:uncharacterized protein LOC127716189 [Mytilus californianus]
MSTNQKACNICDYQHITKPATDWCSECEQAFCSECKVFHGFSRLSQNHATIPILDYLSLEASFATTTIICTEHDEICQMICQTHDKLLCLNCIDKHNDCKNIVPMNEVTKNVKTSTNFQETRQSLTDITKSITQIQDELKLHLQAINDDEKKISAEIDTMRKKLDDHLDKLEHDLRKKLSEEATKSCNSIEGTLKKLEDRKLQITKTQKQMKDLEAYASDYQTYLSLRQISSSVDSVESFLQLVVKDGNIDIDTLILNFDEKINAIVDNIKHFGLVHVQKKTCNVPLIRQKDKQAQLVGLGRPPIKSINDIKLKLACTIDTTCNFIRGCEILTDGKIVFSNSGTNICACVVIFDSYGKHLSNIPVKSGIMCRDVTCIDNNTTLAFSCRFDSDIHFIDINKQEVLHKVISTKNLCYGVAYSDDSLVCSMSGEGIQKIRLDNNKLSTIVKCDLEIGYVAVYNNMLYYTNFKNNVVTCCYMEGQSLWTFRDETVLKKPSGISVDTRGFVYVVSPEMNNIVVLSPDGQEKRVLLTNVDGLKDPWVLHFEKLTNRLLVANSERTAYLFDVLT